MKFDYPRELSFAHPDYQVGCAGTEIPFTGLDSKTYLYVWNKSFGGMNIIVLKATYFCKKKNIT